MIAPTLPGLETQKFRWNNCSATAIAMCTSSELESYMWRHTGEMVNTVPLWAKSCLRSNLRACNLSWGSISPSRCAYACTQIICPTPQPKMFFTIPRNRNFFPHFFTFALMTTAAFSWNVGKQFSNSSQQQKTFLFICPGANLESNERQESNYTCIHSSWEWNLVNNARLALDWLDGHLVLGYTHAESLICKAEAGHCCWLGQTLSDRLQ